MHRLQVPLKATRSESRLAAAIVVGTKRLSVHQQVATTAQVFSKRKQRKTINTVKEKIFGNSHTILITDMDIEAVPDQFICSRETPSMDGSRDELK